MGRFQVNGAVVSVRPKGDKIGMWLGNATASDSIINIGKKVKERLMINADVSHRSGLVLMSQPSQSKTILALLKSGSLSLITRRHG